MKILKSILCFSLFSVLLISCAMNKPNDLVQQNLHKKWMLVQFEDFKKEDLIKLNAFIDLSNQSETPDKYFAKMGCNQMFFNANFKKSTVKFSGVGSTMMMCDDKAMKLEDAFSRVFPGLTQYKIEGHFLTLSNAKGDVMKFVAEDWD